MRQSPSPLLTYGTVGAEGTKRFSLVGENNTLKADGRQMVHSSWPLHDQEWTIHFLLQQRAKLAMLHCQLHRPHSSEITTSCQSRLSSSCCLVPLLRRLPDCSHCSLPESESLSSKSAKLPQYWMYSMLKGNVCTLPRSESKDHRDTMNEVSKRDFSIDDAESLLIFNRIMKIQLENPSNHYSLLKVKEEHNSMVIRIVREGNAQAGFSFSPKVNRHIFVITFA
ncbi:hypothetical protein E2C01_025694 [Portunus trituberculatus]|uniref:Uncharacterized protein n=1 Tax=Portunus trituberculatus TaxID=210409 RepID=A0A5B7EIM5_PORTR|nr:hypothetical protein [Portunus trituberculatus]